MTKRTLAALAATLALALLWGCASGGAPPTTDQPDRLSLTFSMGQSAGASARSLSAEQTLGDYKVQLESTAGTFDPGAKQLTGHVKVHNRSASGGPTMHDTQARVTKLTAVGDEADAFTFTVQVSWYAADPPGDPAYDPGTSPWGSFSCNDDTWNYGNITAGSSSASIPWTFTLSGWTAPAPTGFTLSQSYTRSGRYSAWSQPSGVALADDGRLFVSDTRHHQVIAFNTSGQYQAQYGDGNQGTATDYNSLCHPYGLCLTPGDLPNYDGRLVIANTDVNTVANWKLGTTTWSAVATSSPLTSPLDVAVSATGEVLIAGNATKNVLWSRLGLASSATGAFTHADLSEPAGITLGPDGLVYVSDRTAKKIVRLTITRDAPDGHITKLTHHSTWSPSELQRPRGLCVDYAGFVYVADENAYSIQVLNNAGVGVTSLPLGYRPYDVDVSPDGQYLYVAGGVTGSGSVERYTIGR